MSTSEQLIDVDGTVVRVIRSARRTRTVSADMAEGTLRLRVPMRLSRRQVVEHARTFQKRLASRTGSTAHSDEQLMQRALKLSARYFHGELRPQSVAWSTRQQRRWGSTTSTTGAIRLSTRLRQMPDWVLDSVLVHELAHLQESDHGPAFQQLVARYPRTAEADAFLAGVSWADQHGTA